MLNQRAAGAMHNALRYAGRTRGVHDVERMIERQLFKRDFRNVRLLTLQVRKQRSAFDITSCTAYFCDVGRLLNNLSDHNVLEAIDLLSNLAHFI